jgi:hydroxyacylglutathione hydrolase
MKRLSVIAVLWLGGIITIRAQVFKNNDLQISQLENLTWVIETSDNTTMYIIEGNDRALLIDTGTKCDSLDKVINHITQKPLWVVITHAHHDHAGNIGFFDEIYLHPGDSSLLQKTYRGKLHYIEDGYEFDLGGKTIEVLHMPGHTPGSIVLVDTATHSCYSGDAFGSGQVWLQLRPFAPMSTYIASCDRMIKIMKDEGVSKLYCGHYPYIKKALGIDYLIAMRDLAVSIKEGTVMNPQPYSIKVSIGCENPFIATSGDVSIVYDPEHVNF